MTKVALIGCGNIGSRHLQSLLLTEACTEIWVVEPFAAARETALDRAAATGTHGKKLSFVTKMEELPAALELAVIATAAGDRKAAFDGLMAATRVRSLVFEKFLFPRLLDYDAVAAELDALSIAAWVNCPRRVWEGYSDVRSALLGRTDVTMRQVGSAWGLGSNAVHMLDVYEYVTGQTISGISAERIDPETAAAKRPGYFEIFGTLTGSMDGSGEVSLTCYRSGGLPRLVEFVSSDIRILIDEKTDRAVWTNKDSAWQERPFRTRGVSEMDFVFDRIVRATASDLPTFKEASATHRMVLHSLGGRLGIDVTGGQPCLIT